MESRHNWLSSRRFVLVAFCALALTRMETNTSPRRVLLGVIRHHAGLSLLGATLALHASCALSQGTGTTSCSPRLPADELSRTPRDDEPLEQPALTLSDTLVADQAIYDRLKRDIGAIA